MTGFQCRATNGPPAVVVLTVVAVVAAAAAMSVPTDQIRMCFFQIDLALSTKVRTITAFAPLQNNLSGRKDRNCASSLLTTNYDILGYTMQDEARNTERNHSFWSSDQKLRHAKIQFVTSGALHGDDDSKTTESALAQMSLDSPPREDEDRDETIYEAPPEPNAPFFIDTTGSPPMDTGLPLPRVNSPSPAPSSSSEEVILFTGRDKSKSRADDVKPPLSQVDRIDAKIKVIDEKIHEKEELLHEILDSKDIGRAVTPPDSSRLSRESSIPGSRRKDGRRTRGRRGRASRKREEEDAVLADYLANIDQEDLTLQSFANRELGGSADDVWVDESEEPLGEVRSAQQEWPTDGWDRDNIVDFDDLSTSDGITGDIQTVLSRRDRGSGVQYLVVGEDQTADEARWILSSNLSSARARLEIDKFEAEEKLVAEFFDTESESDDSTGEEDVDSEEDHADEEEFLQRRIERMTDEQIARLLAKQEELGMGSGELQLFDDYFDLGEDEDGYHDEDGDAYSPVPKRYSKTKAAGVKPPHRATRNKGRDGRQAPDIFPKATALADAYDGFDIMDFDRPSLRKKNKGKRGRLVVDLSDSELEASMQMAFANDRLKKKVRKQEREELRAKGLLGSKSGKPDLKQKYKEGMGIDSVKEEIKDFLKGNNTTYVPSPRLFTCNIGD